MGRHKLRTEEEDREYQKVYQRQYYLSRKDSDKEYYKAIFSRTYYRKVLRNMNENDPKRNNVETKINTLTTKMDEESTSEFFCIVAKTPPYCMAIQLS